MGHYLSDFVSRCEGCGQYPNFDDYKCYNPKCKIGKKNLAKAKPMSNPKPPKAVKAWAVVDSRDDEMLEMPESPTYAIYRSECRAWKECDDLRERVIPVMVTPIQEE